MEPMQWPDWIALAQVGAVVGVGTYFAIRLEKIRKLYARNLKRYDLLHTARFNALEMADDCLVELQLAEFDAWKQLQNRGLDDVARIPEDDRQIEQLRRAVQAATISKIKCEKYFKKEFNDEFAELMSKIQHSEMCLRDVRDLRKLVNAVQLEGDKIAAMNKAYMISKPAIPAFRLRMGEIIQKDVVDESDTQPKGIR